ncbi:hypothetical protein [Sphingobacterium daejeonense]|uniref:hypothetical protein n=1 Tax=Sphingobacterium daejeonense TaxID=371142 RepID=UPI001E45B77C|nr:hypothetical protein [Sphingobacterium daejeonense]
MGSIKRYGQYLTFGREIVKEIGEPPSCRGRDYGKKKASPLEYYEPDDKNYLKHRSVKRLEQREEVVLQTDELFSTILKADTKTGYTEFMADDARFYFPWQNEIEGRDNILAFLKKERIESIRIPMMWGVRTVENLPILQERQP